ncbi:MAG: pyridoxamine 5'-phosphate oxidase family protein [Methanoregula sp.]|nr:pyridoxamine 5'-phosphate oxidase family protein [Methanoregula sp.]
MVKLTDEIKESLTGTTVFFLATSSKDSRPNVVPIGAFKLLDDETALISDQFFSKTIKNLKENPQVAVSWWGSKGGFQLKGPVTIHTSGAIFEQDVAWVKTIRADLMPKSAVVMKITDIYQLKPGADAGKKLL